MGVQVHTDTLIARAEPGGFVSRDHERIDADLLVWAAGVKAPAFLSEIAGLETNRVHQVVVDQALRAEGQQRIFALGDCASCQPDSHDKPLPPRAQAAQQMAQHLARELPRMVLFEREPRAFVYHDRGSLVSLSNYSSIGHLMGNLKGGNLFVEGWLARMMYISLYRLHQAMLHGWPRTLLLLLAGRFTKLVRPRLKLH
jgi:NADH dehydrogenase